MQNITPTTLCAGEEWLPLLRGEPLSFSNNLVKSCLNKDIRPIKVVLCDYDFYMILYDQRTKAVMHECLPLFLEESLIGSIKGISRPTVGVDSVYFDVAMGNLLLTYRWGLPTTRSDCEVVCEDVSELGVKQVTGEFPSFIERGGNKIYFAGHLVDFDVLKRQVKSIHYSAFSETEEFFLARFEDGSCVRVDLKRDVFFSFLDNSRAVTQDIIAVDGKMQLSELKPIAGSGYVPI